MFFSQYVRFKVEHVFNVYTWSGAIQWTFYRRHKETGKLGVRISETPSGIYVESLEEPQLVLAQPINTNNSEWGEKKVWIIFATLSIYKFWPEQL